MSIAAARRNRLLLNHLGMIARLALVVGWFVAVVLCLSAALV